jgi:hypothetical protein
MSGMDEIGGKGCFNIKNTRHDIGVVVFDIMPGG